MQFKVFARLIEKHVHCVTMAYLKEESSVETHR